MSYSSEIWVGAAAYLGAGLAVGFGALSVALGEGYAAGKAGQAISKNPSMAAPVMKNMLIGQAVAESAGIFALVVAMLLAFADTTGADLLQAFAYLGAALSMGLAAMGSGFGSGLPAAECCEGIADNPEVQGGLATNMLIGSAMCQTPAIFGMVVSFILIFFDTSGMDLWPSWAAILGAGLGMGLSAIGSGLGSGMPAGAATQGIARQPMAASGLRTNMLIGSAVSQTPAIFGMVVSFLLLYMDWSSLPAWPGWAFLLGAAVSVGLGAFGPGIGNGMIAANAAAGIARMPDTQRTMTPAMLIGMTVSQSTVIYAFLVSLILLVTPVQASDTIVSWMIPLAASLCMGLGAIGPGIGEGFVGACTVTRISRGMENAGMLTRIMLVGMAVTESTAIYSLIVALVLLYVV